MPRTIVKPRSAFRGFTLIEILVVIAVAAILVTIAVMSFNLIDNDRAVQKQVIKLSSLIDMASDEAQIQGRDYGLEFLQEDMVVELFLEDHRILLQEAAENIEEDEDDRGRDNTEHYLPHVLIMASGDITPFRLEIVRLTDDQTVGLKVEFGGELEIVRDDQEL